MFQILLIIILSAPPGIIRHKLSISEIFFAFIQIGVHHQLVLLLCQIQSVKTKKKVMNFKTLEIQDLVDLAFQVHILSLLHNSHFQ